MFKRFSVFGVLFLTAIGLGSLNADFDKQSIIDGLVQSSDEEGHPALKLISLEEVLIRCVKKSGVSLKNGSLNAGFFKKFIKTIGKVGSAAICAWSFAYLTSLFATMICLRCNGYSAVLPGCLCMGLVRPVDILLDRINPTRNPYSLDSVYYSLILSSVFCTYSLASYMARKLNNQKLETMLAKAAFELIDLHSSDACVRIFSADSKINDELDAIFGYSLPAEVRRGLLIDNMKERRHKLNELLEKAFRR